MIDIANHLTAIHREVHRRKDTETSGETVAVLLRREYDADVADVWDALTDPDRLKRWFLPVSGEFKVGGTFQLEGNAGGDILDCDPPTRLRVTFGGETSIVELRLAAAGEQTVLELEHTVPIEMAGGGAGALFVGPGWDGMLLALALHTAGVTTDDPVAAGNSPEGQAFSRGSAQAWAATITASGTATPEEIDSALQASIGHFAPDAPA